MRQTPGKVRRIWIGLNPFPQPSSGQDGWAHYAEQLVLDEGFQADDPRYRMAQLSEAMTRICRLISGIRLHTGEWTVDQAATLFEQQAHLPPPAARQEAERGTYDPTYGGYFLGKLAGVEAARRRQGHGGRGVRPARLPRAGDDQRHRAVVGAPPAAAAGRRRAAAAVMGLKIRPVQPTGSCSAARELTPSSHGRFRRTPASRPADACYENPIQRPAAATDEPQQQRRRPGEPLGRSGSTPSTPMTRCRTANVKISASGRVVIFTQNAWL